MAELGATASIDCSSVVSPAAAPWERRFMPSMWAPMTLIPSFLASAMRAAARASSSSISMPAAPMPLRLAPMVMMSDL